jgi:hypothetical protein
MLSHYFILIGTDLVSPFFAEIVLKNVCAPMVTAFLAVHVHGVSACR